MFVSSMGSAGTAASVSPRPSRRLTTGPAGMRQCAGASPRPTPPAPPRDAGAPPPSDAGTDAEPNVDPRDLLAEIDTIVVVMMENRSFDHFLGALSLDASYTNKATVAGLNGTESNPNSMIPDPIRETATTSPSATS